MLITDWLVHDMVYSSLHGFSTSLTCLLSELKPFLITIGMKQIHQTIIHWLVADSLWSQSEDCCLGLNPETCWDGSKIRWVVLEILDVEIGRDKNCPAFIPSASYFGGNCTKQIWMKILVLMKWLLSEHMVKASCDIMPRGGDLTKMLKPCYSERYFKCICLPYQLIGGGLLTV